MHHWGEGRIDLNHAKIGIDNTVIGQGIGKHQITRTRTLGQRAAASIDKWLVDIDKANIRDR